MSISVETLALAKKNTKQAVEEAVTSVYKYRGSVETFEDLPTSGQKVGDVYNVEKEAGRNYAWDGSNWDALGIAENLGDIEFEGEGIVEKDVSFDGNNDRVNWTQYVNCSKAIPLENLASNQILITCDGREDLSSYLGYAFSNNNNSISAYNGPGYSLQEIGNNQYIYTIPDGYSDYKYFFLPLTTQKTGPQGMVEEKAEYFINPIITYTTLGEGTVTKTINNDYLDKNQTNQAIKTVADQANSAYNQANIADSKASSAYNKANAASNAANNAYNEVKNKVDKIRIEKEEQYLNIGSTYNINLTDYSKIDFSDTEFTGTPNFQLTCGSDVYDLTQNPIVDVSNYNSGIVLWAYSSGNTIKWSLINGSELIEISNIANAAYESASNANNSLNNLGNVEWEKEGHKKVRSTDNPADIHSFTTQTYSQGNIKTIEQVFFKGIDIEDMIAYDEAYPDDTDIPFAIFEVDNLEECGILNNPNFNASNYSCQISYAAIDRAANYGGSKGVNWHRVSGTNKFIGFDIKGDFKSTYNWCVNEYKQGMKHHKYYFSTFGPRTYVGSNYDAANTYDLKGTLTYYSKEAGGMVSINTDYWDANTTGFEIESVVNYTNNKINIVYNMTNSANSVATNAYNKSNIASNTANNAQNTANNAYNMANTASNAANNAVNSLNRLNNKGINGTQNTFWIKNDTAYAKNFAQEHIYTKENDLYDSSHFNAIATEILLQNEYIFFNISNNFSNTIVYLYGSNSLSDLGDSLGETYLTYRTSSQEPDFHHWLNMYDESIINTIKNYKYIFIDSHAGTVFSKTQINSIKFNEKIDIHKSLNNYYDKTASNSLANDTLNAAKTYTDSKFDISMKKEVVQQLPVSNIDEDTLYLVPKSNSTNGDVYDEYLYASNEWELIGNTATDLSGYYTSNQVDNIASNLSNDISNVTNIAANAQNSADQALNAAANAQNDATNALSDSSNASNVANDAYSLASNANNSASNASNLAQAAYDAANLLAPAAWQEIANTTTNETTNSVVFPLDKEYDEYFVTFNYPVKTDGNNAANSITSVSGDSLMVYLGGQSIVGNKSELYMQMNSFYNIKKIDNDLYHGTCYNNNIAGTNRSYSEGVGTVSDATNGGLELRSQMGTTEIESGVKITVYGKNILAKEAAVEEGELIV